MNNRKRKAYNEWDFAFLAGLLRGGLTMVAASEIVGITDDQGRYGLLKMGFKPTDLKASPDYAKNTFSKAGFLEAIDLMTMGGTPEDIFFVTGITMNRLLAQVESIEP